LRLLSDKRVDINQTNDSHIFFSCCFKPELSDVLSVLLKDPRMRPAALISDNGLNGIHFACCSRNWEAATKLVLDGRVDLNIGVCFGFSRN